MPFNYDKATDLERREEIARRLGWREHLYKDSPRWIAPKDAHLMHPTVRHVGVPPYTTDPGLAFAELWPRVLTTHPRAALLLKDGQPSLFLECPSMFWPSGRTWAEAICRAFLALTEAKEKE